MNRKKYYSLKNAKGLAMVELAMLLPLLVTFIFAGLEFSRSFRAQQLAASYSREAANYIMRTCSGKSSNNDISNCMNEYQNTINTILGSLLDTGDIVLILSLYTYNPGDASVTQIISPASAQNSAACTNSFPDFQSRFHPSAGAISICGLERPSIISPLRIMAIAEVYVPNSGIFTKLFGIGSAASYNPNYFYEATIM